MRSFILSWLAIITAVSLALYIHVSIVQNIFLDKSPEKSPHDRIVETLFPEEEIPDIACTSNDKNIGKWEPSYVLKISCEANSWGRWEVYHVSETGEILDFRNAVMYNDSLGVVFTTNPVELYVIFYDHNGTKADVWLHIDSNLKSCVPANKCFRP